MEKLKRIFSKNSLIAVLMAMNLGSIGYFIYDKSGFQFRTEKKPSTAKKAAQVQGGSFSGESSELQLCYQSYLSREPEKSEGSVLTHMMINSAGQITSLKVVESDLGDEQFTQCLIAKLKERKIKATPNRVGVLIAHRYHFQQRTLSQMNF